MTCVIYQNDRLFMLIKKIKVPHPKKLALNWFWPKNHFVSYSAQKDKNLNIWPNNWHRVKKNLYIILVTNLHCFMWKKVFWCFYFKSHFSLNGHDYDMTHVRRWVKKSRKKPHDIKIWPNLRLFHFGYFFQKSAFKLIFSKFIFWFLRSIKYTSKKSVQNWKITPLLLIQLF